MAVNTWRFQDFTKEKSTLTVYSADLTAANFAAQETARNALYAAITNLQIATLNHNSYGNQVIGVSTPPINPLSQRENKWLVRYVGFSSGKIFQMEIPCAELTALHLLGNSDEADFTDVDWAAFGSAFQTFARTPDDPTETVTLLDAHFVGRNL